MSDYTGELRHAVEYAKRLGIKTGLEDYPIFAEVYRPRLNRVILEHYWLREVGTETYELFFFQLRRRLFRDMPMFNLAYSAIENANILTTYETTSKNKSQTRSSNHESSESSNTTSSKSGSLSSQFPQQMLKSDGDYATSGGRSSSSSDGSSRTSGDGTSETINDALNDTSGRQGTVTRLMSEYLDAYINVDARVVAGLSDLFLNVWGSGQRMTPQPFELYNQVYPYNMFGVW